jgi:hypothetical protein
MKTILANLAALIAIPFFCCQIASAQSISLTAPSSGASYSSPVNFPLNFTITEPSGSPQSISLELTNNSSTSSKKFFHI